MFYKIKAGGPFHPFRFGAIRMKAQNKQAVTLERHEPLLTAAEAAYMLHISRTRLYRLIRSGQLPVLHLGRMVRFVPQDIRDFISRTSKRKVAGGSKG